MAECMDSKRKKMMGGGMYGSKRKKMMMGGIVSLILYKIWKDVMAKGVKHYKKDGTEFKGN